MYYSPVIEEIILTLETTTAPSDRALKIPFVLVYRVPVTLEIPFCLEDLVTVPPLEAPILVRAETLYMGGLSNTETLMLAPVGYRQTKIM